MKGFTLAEVLITLLIVGVVASIVVPSIINDTQEAELHTAWRKTYADLDLATRRIMADNGGTMIGAVKRNGAVDWSEPFKNKYAEYLNYTKSCTRTAIGNCWSNTFKFLNGTNCDFFGAVPIGYAAGTGDSVTSGLILTNGVFLAFQDAGGYVESCEYGEASSFPYERQVCGSIYADVNGFKGPNTIGKDIFLVHVIRNGIKPWGYMPMDTSLPMQLCIQAPDTNWSSGSNKGYACSLKYLYQ